jgi:hypothetical protein
LRPVPLICSKPLVQVFVAPMPAVAFTFPPLVKGGPGGVGRRTSASSVDSSIARDDVSIARAVHRDESAHSQSTSSIAPGFCPTVHSTVARPTPPNPPFTRGGKKRARSPNSRDEVGTNARAVQPQLFISSPPPSSTRKEGDRTRTGPVSPGLCNSIRPTALPEGQCRQKPSCRSSSVDLRRAAFQAGPQRATPPPSR